MLQPLRVNAIPYLLKHGCQPMEHQSNPFTIAVSCQDMSDHLTTAENLVFNVLMFSYRFQVSNGAWWYFFSKVIELLDTVRDTP